MAGLWRILVEATMNDKSIPPSHSQPSGVDSTKVCRSAEQYLQKTMEESVVAAVLRAAEPSRRQFLVGLGAATLTALITELFPMARLQAFAAEPARTPEKKDVSIGFIP